jgi:hypothetical protein
MHDRIPKSTPGERRLRREAHSAALRDRALVLRQTGATYAAIGGVLGVSLERARQIVKRAERLTYHPRWCDGLPTRVQTFLQNMDLAARPEIDAVIAVAQLSRRELLGIPNFGVGACAAVVAWLAGHGLKLRPESAYAFVRRMRGFPMQAGAPSQERPSDSNGPLAAGRNEVEQACLYLPRAI